MDEESVQSVPNTSYTQDGSTNLSGSVRVFQPGAFTGEGTTSTSMFSSRSREELCSPQGMPPEQQELQDALHGLH